MDMSNEVEKSCSQHFRQKRFPELIDGKINTTQFLAAARGVVDIVDKFGRAFSPLSYDISGNIEKLEKNYERNTNEHLYIEDMILSEKEGVSTDALLWLQRALYFFLIFFQRVIEDKQKTESLTEHMTEAYVQTLEPHHGWITKKLFVLFKRMVPNRSDLLSTVAQSKDYEEENVIESLKIYIEGLAANVYHIISFYKEHNLLLNQKAP